MNNALGTWDSKLAEIWQLLTQDPASFRGGGIWQVMLGVNGALQAIGYGLLVLFFAVGVVRTCGSFAEARRPETALKLFIRFILAKAAVGQGLELMLALFSVVQGMVSTIITQAGISGGSDTTLPAEIVEKIEEFRKSHTLYFLIGSLETLVSAGRMNRAVGMMATMLNIHPLCGEDGDGNIKVYQKVRGMTQALNRLVEMVGERGETLGRHLVISQCNNPEDAEMLRKACQRRYPFAKISVLEMRGLASFYAGDRGLILAY